MSESILLNEIIAVTRYTSADLGYEHGRTRYQITDRLTGIVITLSDEQWENIRAALGPEYPGIELRISNLSGELTRADSGQLHHVLKYGQHGVGVGGDHWQELLPGLDWPADTPLPARLKIELRPVTLGGVVDVDEGLLM
jgi:hypothetical protein